MIFIICSRGCLYISCSVVLWNKFNANILRYCIRVSIRYKNDAMPQRGPSRSYLTAHAPVSVVAGTPTCRQSVRG